MAAIPRDQLTADAASAYARASRLLDPLRLQVWEDLGITFPQLRILFLVHHRPDRDLRSLADRLSIGASAASQQVERLVERALLTRREDTEDRRRICLELTPRGIEAVESISAVSREYLSALFANLTDDQLQTLTGSLRLLIEAAASIAPPQFTPEPATTPAAPATT